MDDDSLETIGSVYVLVAFCAFAGLVYLGRWVMG